MRRIRRMMTFALLAVVTVGLFGGETSAEAFGNQHFKETWQRTDQPIAAGQVNRTWMWGPEANSQALLEPYVESPNGKRVVQYYDKSRMEITDPAFDQSSPWYVTNGLLVVELITGKLQTGDDQRASYEPAHVNVAGDSGGTTGPTYAALQNVLNAPPVADGAAIIQRIDREGQVSDDPELLSHGVTAAYLVPETQHQIAGPFWNFMRSSGLIYQAGDYVEAPLFESPFFATGFPITEAYWATVQVGGVTQDVLLQCFERRCLTYTPGNDEGWQVESGNVGIHYYQWRYEQLDFEPEVAPIPTTGDVRITFILANPTDYGEEVGEYVDIQSFAPHPINMTGWTLQDASTATFTFPDGYVLNIGASVRIHICDGTNTPAELYWGRCSAVWNNSGDTATLKDATGKVIFQYSY